VALNGKPGKALVVASDALVLMDEGDDRMPVRGPGKRVVPGDNALFAWTCRSVLARKEGVMVDRETSGDRYGEQDPCSGASKIEESLPSVCGSRARHFRSQIS
jgi:hypothetical protein